MAPRKPNTALRVGIPLLLAGVAVFAAWAVMVNSSPTSNTQPAVQQPTPQQADQQADTQPVAADDAQVPADTDTTEKTADVVPTQDDTTQQPAGDLPEAETADTEPELAEASAADGAQTESQARPGDFRARVGAAADEFSILGGLDPDGTADIRMRFDPVSAGVESLRLASEFLHVKERAAWQTTGELNVEDHVEIQSQQATSTGIVTPFASLWAEIDGAIVGLYGEGIWQETSPGSFEAVIENDAGEPQVRITRTYVLTEGSLDVLVSQRIENLSETQHKVRLVTFGPIDLPKGTVTYGGDRRRVRFGYLLRPGLDPNRNVVQAKKFLSPRSKFLGPKDEAPGALRVNPDTGNVFKPYTTTRQVWPTETTLNDQLSLVWAGMANRYYAVAVHGEIAPDTTDRTFTAVEKIERVVLQADNQPKDGTLILRLSSPAIVVPAGGASTDASYRFYAGPKHEPTIRDEPEAAAAGIESVVAYNFGGPCAICTFTWLTGPLLGALRVFHDLVGDWSLAIIMLVFCVRGVLHPVNRWSQIRVQRFGKQMQDLAPKQKKIQEKFKDDRQRVQQEMAKLWREEGVNPAGMLGCLPMLLQSPIWIALYASLFYFFDLRQQPVFYGIIQTVTSGNWLFMADLSEPDHFVTLPDRFHFAIPLMGVIRSFNVLPIVLGVVYFMHMKFMTPPTSATLSPEQESTQKIAKYMTVFMFPIIMYNAPSGLALYFITNSTTAILENTWIRKHIKKHNLLEVTKKPKKPGKPGGGGKKSGFLSKLQEIAEKQQEIRQQQQQARQGGAQPGKGESAAQRAIRKSRENNQQ